jgi:hydroxypyruvate isomerase
VSAALQDCSWDGFIGCEYKPSATTESGLRWLEEAMARERAGRYEAL